MFETESFVYQGDSPQTNKRVRDSCTVREACQLLRRGRCKLLHSRCSTKLMASDGIVMNARFARNNQ